MSCTRYRKLLHLNRAGEISLEEADELRRHLRLCEPCALELQRIERADTFIDQFRAVTPAPGNPEHLTARILRRVGAESLQSRPISAFDRFVEYFSLPLVRYSAAAVVVLVSATFMIQLLTTLTDIAALERRMASTAESVPPEATYSIQSKTLQTVVATGAGLPIKAGFSLDLTDDRIDIPAIHVDVHLSGGNLRNLAEVLGAAALRIDKKTLDKIVTEVKASAELTFRIRHEGA